MKKILLVTLLLITPSLTLAHDYWFEPKDAELLLMRGHRDFSAHKGTKIVPYKPDIVKSAKCRVNTNDSILPKPVGPYPVRIRANCDQLLVEVDSGFWSQTLTGAKNQHPNQLKGVFKSWRSLETVKLVKKWNSAAQKPLGRGLELVLTSDPFATGVGKKLRLQAWLNGKPAAGVAVAYDGKARGVTGKDGSINIKARHAGQQMITASLETPLSNGSVKKQVQSTSLMFTL